MVSNEEIRTALVSNREC